MSQEVVAIELKNLRDSKLSNIAITINKVTRILRLIGSDKPPIRAMTPREVYFAMWGATDSVKCQLVEVLKSMEQTAEVQNCYDFIASGDAEGQGPQEEDDAAMEGDEEHQPLPDQYFTDKIQ